MNSTSRSTVRGRLVGMLALCAVACALPAAMMAWSRIEDARMARRETAGLVPARQLLQVIRLTQQHRGASAVWLGGNEAAAAQREATRSQLEAAIAAFDATLRADGAEASRLGRAWQHDREAWQDLGSARNANEPPRSDPDRHEPTATNRPQRTERHISASLPAGRWCPSGIPCQMPAPPPHATRLRLVGHPEGVGSSAT